MNRGHHRLRRGRIGAAQGENIARGGYSEYKTTLQDVKEMFLSKRLDYINYTGRSAMLRDGGAWLRFSGEGRCALPLNINCKSVFPVQNVYYCRGSLPFTKTSELARYIKYCVMRELF